MSGSRTGEPWKWASRQGVLLRKNKNKGFFEPAYKDKYMCWLSREALHMRAAEVVTFRSHQGSATSEKVVVADEEETFLLHEWTLGESDKDLKAGKFTLTSKKPDGGEVALRCDTALEAQEWINDIRAAVEEVMGGKKDKEGNASRHAGQRPTAPGFDAQGGRADGFGGANAGRGIKKEKKADAQGKKEKDTKEDTQPNKAREKSPGGEGFGFGFKFEGGVPKPGEWKGRGGEEGEGVKEGARENKDKDANKLHGSDLAFEYANGDTYRGDWHYGKKQGRGTYMRSDGTKYEGEYVDDRKEGQGRCSWANGNVYVGTWSGGIQQGPGVLTCPDGRKYQGEWVQGKQHGRGFFTTGDSGSTYDGMWREGLKHGHGVAQSADGNVYEGEWVDNKKHGKGKHSRPDGSTYDGDWKLDKKHGKGKYIYGNGDTYEGETRDGHKHGQGTFVAANGAKYEGEWIEGKKHGKGVYVSALGKEHRCSWVNDKPVDGNPPKEHVPTPGHDGRDRPAPGPDAGRPGRPEEADRSKGPRAQEKPAQGAAGGDKGGGKGGWGWYRPGTAPARDAGADTGRDAGADAKGGAKTAEDEAAAARRRADEEANARAEERAKARLAEDEAMKAANMSGPVLVGLQEELDKVKAAAKTGTTALVKHIIKAHPPKSNQEVQLDFSEAGIRKTLLKVIRMYHQDKNPMEEHGLEWHLLCREITKQLNAKLELYK